MNSTILLLRTLLLSTSQLNIYRHTNDKAKRRRIVGMAIGYSLLYATLLAYGIVACVGYGSLGVADVIPVLCALSMSVLTFALTLFKSNGYLFGFREYDLLMSLPFPTRTVAACKFLYMYVKSLPWCATISVSMMIGYGLYAHPAVVTYLIWLLLSSLLPIIPMLAASFLGFLFAKVSARFRKAHIIQTVLTFAFIIFCFSLRFVIEGLIGNGEVEQTLETASKAAYNMAGTYAPAGWFANAITRLSMLDSLLLVGTSALLFAIVFFVVGTSYRSINSALMSHRTTKSYRIGAQKQRNVVTAIAYKEFRRLCGSTVYMTNAALGEVMAILLGLVALVIGFDRLVGIVTRDAPFDHSVLYPAIPFIVYFFIGMFATTVCTPSLEGKSYWIVLSLPLSKKTLYDGKMLFNLCLTVPAMAISTLCLCVAAHLPVIDTLLYLVQGFALCAFSTTLGCVCGTKHMRLDWENEIEVIKQGAAVALYLLPNMFVTMGITVLSVFLGMHTEPRLLALGFTLLYTLLAVLCYWWVAKD